MENYYKKLPEGYRDVGVMFDLSNKKTSIILNIIAVILFFLVLYPFYLFNKDLVKSYLVEKNLVSTLFPLFLVVLYIFFMNLYTDWLTRSL